MTVTNHCPQCGDGYEDDVTFCPRDGTRLKRAGGSGDLIGTVIADRYRIVSRIGEGGMGQVFLAEHVRMKRKSAIKIMRSALVGDIEALRRFTREAEHASQLSHQNIAAIYDFGETADGTVYLAMEYVDGESLGAKLDRDAALHPDVAADILGQASDALQAAHDVDMLHRDIKPDNIMLGLRPDGTYLVKLVDFGIARTINSAETRVTRTGYAVGTPEYMSPEQLAGDTLDARSDQYSLALVAFYALTGKQAFPSDSSRESLVARLTSLPRTLQDARREIEWPAPLQDVFNRALAPDAVNRFDTISDFAHAFAGAIGGMTPSQTAELYRRALDTRVANVAARTPHSDLEGWRSASGSVGATRTPAAQPSGAGDTPVSTTADTIAATVTGPSLRALSPATPTPKAKVSTPRWLVISGFTALLATTLWIAIRRGGTNPDATATDAASQPSGAPSMAQPPSAAPNSPAVSTPNATRPVSAPSPSTATGARPAATLATDSVKRARDDSLRRLAQRARTAKADSLASASNARARYPEGALRVLISRGIDAKAHTVRSGDVRAVLMSPPVFVWRAEELRAWKEAHPSSGGAMLQMVDPIEAWGVWLSLVASRRPVYVLEVTAEKTPWPSYAPERIFDIKKGDVESAEVLRDGTPILFVTSERVAALINATAHRAAGKAVPNALVATLPPTTFAPREDGSWPKIEVLVHDAGRAGAITRLALPESLVRRLYDEFAPWRDGIAKP